MPKGEKKAGGRPKTIKKYSERVKKNWLAAAAKIAKETGMKIEEHLLRMVIGYKCPICEGTGTIKLSKQELCYGCKGRGMFSPAQDTAIVGIGKLYNEALLVKESEQTINDNRSGPSIGLPPMKERPAAPPPVEATESAEKRVH